MTVAEHTLEEVVNGEMANPIQLPLPHGTLLGISQGSKLNEDRDLVPQLRRSSRIFDQVSRHSCFGPSNTRNRGRRMRDEESPQPSGSYTARGGKKAKTLPRRGSYTSGSARVQSRGMGEAHREDDELR